MPLHNYKNFCSNSRQNSISRKLPIEKFTEYIFADKHALNGKKALFESLGFDIMDAKRLKAEFEKQAQEKYSAGNYTLAN